MERRLERIHARARRADRLARAAGDGDRGGLLRQERALGDGGRPGERRRDARRRAARHRLLRLHAAGDQDGRLRLRRAPTRTRSSGWSGRCSACPSRPTPTTPPMHSRWRSATAAATGRREAVDRRGGTRPDPPAPTGGRMIAAVRGEVMVRRPDHVVIDAGGVGYRLAVSAETLKAVPATGRRGLPARRADLPRGLARPLRLRLRGGARPLPRADLGQRHRAQSGDRGALRRRRPRAAAGDSGGDAKRFQAVPGIGKRTSERIIVELREKVAGALEEEVAIAAAEEGRRPLARPRRPRQPRLRAA